MLIILMNGLNNLKRNKMKRERLDCPYDFTSRCTMGRCDCKPKEERMYSEEDMIEFAEFVATYPDKNRNYKKEMLHAKSKYDGAERTIDLLQIWFEQIKKK